MAKRTTLVTPKGRAIYPRLNTPDTKFDEDGVYKVTLAIPTKEAEPTLEAIDKEAARALAEAKKANPKKNVKEADLPYKVNPDNEEETLINFKMKAKITKKDGEVVTMKPGLYDAKGRNFDKDKVIGGGSILRVAFEAGGFYTALVGAGVSLRLKSVQVIKLEEYTGGTSFSGSGFEAEEGYEAGEGEDDESAEKPEKDFNAETSQEKKDDAATDGSDF